MLGYVRLALTRKFTFRGTIAEGTLKRLGFCWDHGYGTVQGVVFLGDPASTLLVSCVQEKKLYQVEVS